MRPKWTRRLAGACLLAGLLTLAAAWGRDRLEVNQRRHLLSTMLLASKFYATDHGGARPPRLQTLFPRYINSPFYLAYTSNDVDYFSGLTDESNPATVLIREKRPDKWGRRWEGTIDCSATLARLRPAPAVPP